MRLLTLALSFLFSMSVAAQDGPKPTATLKMGAASAAPGGTAAVPVLVNGSGPVQGFSFSIDFDETILELESIEPLWLDGTNWLNEFYPDGSIRWINVRTADDLPGDSGIAEGYLAGAIVFDAKFRDLYPPPGEDSEIFALHLGVKPTAPPGSTELRFIDGAKPFPNNPSIPNIVTIQSKSVAADKLQYVTEPLLISSRLNIIGTEAPRFIRGDSNGDSTVDLSDAVFSLAYLFLGGTPPGCIDAADADDDGAVDIVDPVFTLAFLFLDGLRPPEPFEFPGPDPTGDDLPCNLGSAI
jgi:hypothetical protein